MENNATIMLKTLQTSKDEEPSVIELCTKGRFAEKDGKFYVIYEESEMTGFEDTTTTIKVENERISMTRKGKYSGKMIFVRGEKRICSMHTPFGLLPVGVNPISMTNGLTADGGELRIEYMVDFDNRDCFKNELRLTVTKS